jgi:hypothetical protein
MPSGPDLPVPASIPGSHERFASMLLHALDDPVLARAIHAAVRRIEGERANHDPGTRRV